MDNIHSCRENIEADGIADGMMRSFRRVLELLTKAQRLRATKRLLLHVRTALETMELEQ